MRARLMAVLAACILVLFLVPGASAATVGSGMPTAVPVAGTPVMATPVTADEAEGEAITGTLRDPDREPVPDVTFTVDQDGTEVGSATTDAEGVWEVEVPGPGSYRITMDTETLPSGLQPRDSGGEQLSDVQIRTGQQRTVIFPLISGGGQQDEDAPDTGSTPAEGADVPEEGAVTTPPPGAPSEGSPFLDRVMQLSVEGLKLGAIIAITAVGLSLVFGTTRLINFAHGELVTVGAVTAYFVSTSPGSVQLILAAGVAIVVGALLGGGVERGIWRPLRKRGTGLIQMFIISIGLSLFLRYLVLAVYGSRRGQYADYTVQQAVELGPIAITPRDLVVTVISFVLLILVGLALQTTRIGKATRAVSDNRDLAQASGINVDRVVLIVWVLGGALAALGGVFFGLTQAVYWDMGFNLLLLMFAGVILGGLGSAYGAMIGSILIGLVSQLSTLWFPPSLQNAWALLVLILVLLLRPQGILGRSERAG